MIIRRLIVCFLLLSAGAVYATPFERMDVFALEWVSAPAISPDGDKVVFVRNGMDIMKDGKTSRLWLCDSDGDACEPLTGRDTNESSPVWSPDGRQIAFVSSALNGSEIFVYRVASGKTQRLTELPRSPSGLRWSPDGSRIAFTMKVEVDAPVLVKPPQKPEDAEWSDAARITDRLHYERDGAGYIDPGFDHVFVVPAIGGHARQVTTGAFDHGSDIAWIEEGGAIVVSGNRNADWEMDFNNSELYRVPLDGGDISALTSRKGMDAAPVVSPDGQKIAWLSIDDKVQTYQLTRLRIMDVDGSNKRDLLVDLDRSIAAMQWDGNSNSLVVQYDEHGDTRLARASLGGRMRAVAKNVGGTTIGRPYGGGSFSLARNGTVAFTHVSPYRPAELAVQTRRADTPTVITHFSDNLLAQRELGKVEEIWYASTVDDNRIQGWIVYPPGYSADEKYPLLVENHGGPIANYGARFSPEIQLYAAAGYIVFYPNPRGSTGYGEAFGNLLYNNYPGDDYQDVMDGVDALIEKGIAHEDRLYVTGGSAGGIMTAWMIGKNNRFRAAAVIKPVMNWISKTLTADNYFRYADYRYPGQPWENIETYMKFSPVSLVGNIETPALVMVGTEDMRTPLSEAKQLYGALKIRGIDTVLVEIPGAPHNIAGKPSQLIAKIDHILAWFAKYPPN